MVAIEAIFSPSKFHFYSFAEISVKILIVFMVLNMLH